MNNTVAVSNVGPLPVESVDSDAVSCLREGAHGGDVAEAAVDSNVRVQYARERAVVVKHVRGALDRVVIAIQRDHYTFIDFL